MIQPTTPAATKAFRPSDILVVSANLAEAHDPADIAETGDMKAFAARVKALLPRPPDVLLLQEVAGPSVEAVAKHLKQAAGVAYTVGIWPAPKNPRVTNSTTDYVRDTAILLNTSTTTVRGAKGHVVTRYDSKDKTDKWHLVRAKEHARVLAYHSPSKTSLALMSVHLAPGAFVNPERFFQYTERWAGEICADMKKNCPRRGRQINILAGDFNNRRTMEKKETVKGEVTPMWARLKKEGYKDVVFAVHGKSDKALQKQYEKGGQEAKRIDYIFVNGGDVVDASFDLAAPKYSDHRLLWAAVRSSVRRTKALQ